MSVNPQTLQVPTVPYNLTGLAAANAYANQQQQNVQQPWGVHISQQVNDHTLSPGDNGIGFDTLDYDTYQALAGNNYNLQFISETYSSNVYPYSQISVPIYGMYDVRFQFTGVTSPSSSYTMQAQIYINGSPKASNGDVFEADMANPTVNVNDIFLLNPNDIIAFNIAIGIAGFTTNSAEDVYASIRYLGPG